MRATRLAAFAACLFAACDKAPDPAPSTPQPAAGKAPTTLPPRPGDPAPAGTRAGAAKPADPAAGKGSVDGIRLTLVDAGKEPRRTLRYRPVAGAKGQFEYVTTQKNKVSTVPHLTVQTTTMVADVEVLAVDAAGNADVRMSMHDMRTEMPGQPGADEANALFEGFRFHFAARMSPRGAMSNTEVGLDADPSGKLGAVMKPMFDSLGQTMNQISVALPEEAVGVGAKWTLEGSMTLLGMTVTSTGTNTIESMSDDRVVLSTVMTGGVQDQKMTMSGIESEVHSMSMDGTGTVTLDLTSVVAGSLETTAHSKGKMTIHVPDNPPQKMEVETTMEMKFAQKK
jgi:hypothetical protein